ncbi:hypothetical protein Ngar_c03480 [Candidatus Nitrososphaera gargensis Ga9.2]|uniref:Uncharacterized protein n=1 Tax=Nitrososphaera gargensis (strain Ga9.2) TaxID=1237085 RepID=K0I7R2_NITGG|nr:hypothetical protein [Candidatus Nitrososphaera gargensis]AFU57266.1 hypothetical protein Ngar_c03180 [Candidatus Nitrososphaera gargensis Ga9.2]AFU57296.1 hypothetical protein Ngar_c03480 [Candidatus Nitrososphaera gargensis Ga9.2]
MSQEIPIEIGVICKCGQAFKHVLNFVNHAKKCDKFAKTDSGLKRIAEQLLSLKEGSLA